MYRGLDNNMYCMILRLCLVQYVSEWDPRPIRFDSSYGRLLGVSGILVVRKLGSRIRRYNSSQSLRALPYLPPGESVRDGLERRVFLHSFQDLEGGQAVLGQEVAQLPLLVGEAPTAVHLEPQILLPEPEERFMRSALG